MDVIEWTSRLRAMRKHHKSFEKKIKKYLTSTDECDNLDELSRDSETKNLDN